MKKLVALLSVVAVGLMISTHVAAFPKIISSPANSQAMIASGLIVETNNHSDMGPKGGPVDGDSGSISPSPSGIVSIAEWPASQFDPGLIDIDLGDPDADTDGDGVLDSADACPDTPEGANITEDGCPDTDNDGIADKDDTCDIVQDPAVISGCEDYDGDGVIDIYDDCPEVSGSVDNNGCPVKKDPVISGSTLLNSDDGSTSSNSLDAFADQGCNLIQATGSALNGIVPMLILAFSMAPIAIRRRKCR